MNTKSRLLTEEILKGSQIFYTQVYTPFLQIPVQILPSNSKIICIVLQCLACMDFYKNTQLLDFNNEAISKFTGIPAGTINRILKNIENQIEAANNWLIDNNFSERLQLTKLKQFATATIYNFEHTPPVRKEIFNAAINENITPAETKTPRKLKNEFYIDSDLKLKSLLNTGFDPDDLKTFFKYPIEKITRNVKYFKENYLDKGKEANFNLLKLTFSHDWGKKYISDQQKAIEYLKELHSAIEIIESNLTPDIKEKIKSAYKFTPQYNPENFKIKSDIIKHCNYKINSLPELTRKGLLNSAARYTDYLKHAAGFNGRTDESILETCKFAALQIIHSAINFNPIIKNIAA